MIIGSVFMKSSFFCLVAVGFLLGLIGCSGSSKPATESKPMKQPLDADSTEQQPLQLPTLIAQPGDQVKVAIDETPAIASASELRDRAFEALDAGNTKQAYDFCRQSLSLEPDNLETRFMWARVLASRHRFGEAIHELDQLGKISEEIKWPALGQSADWLVLDGRYDEAEKRLRMLVAAFPDQGMVNRTLMRLLVRQGRHQEARDLALGLCKAGDVSGTDLRLLLGAFDPDEQAESPIGAGGFARKDLIRGDIEAALQRFENTQELQPHSLALRGRLLALVSQHDALRTWSEADVPESCKEFADYWFAMGRLSESEEQYAMGARHYCEAMIRDRSDREAHLGLGRMLARLGRENDADQAKQRAEFISQTRKVAAELSQDPAMRSKKAGEIAHTLESLQRPIEALAWRTLELSFAVKAGALEKSSAMSTFKSINEKRLELESIDEDTIRKNIMMGIEPRDL